MLKRSSPRSRSARVMANGNVVGRRAADLARCAAARPRSAARARRCPRRAAAPSCPWRRTRSPRAGRTAARRAYPGGSRTSRKQKAQGTGRVPRRCAPDGPNSRPRQRSTLPSALAFCLASYYDNCHHLARVQARQELPRPVGIELRVGRLDGQKELVLAREAEAPCVEDRVIRLRQPVQRDHRR